MAITSEMAAAIVARSRRGPRGFTVLYDERCALCRRLRAWLARQPTTVPIEYLAADSPAAHRRFPHLDHQRSTTVLTVVARTGAVYESERAWLVCAWALPGWQQFAEHFSTRFRVRLVRLAVNLVDGHRHRLLATYGGLCDGRCHLAADPSSPTAGR